MIYGLHFGSAGSVQVCTNATGSCVIAAGFSASTSAQYSYWSDTQVNALLTSPSYSAGGTFYLQVVVSTDLSGAAFSASAQESSGNASNESPFAVAPPPEITVITPALGPVGGSVEVFLSGSGFGTSPTVTVKDAGGTSIPVTINKSQNSGDTLIDATLAIPANAAGGNAIVTVAATAGGPASNSVNFYVQIPTSLVRQTVGCPPSGPCTAPAGAPNGLGPVYTPGTPPPNGSVVNAIGVVVDNATNVCGVFVNLGYSLVDQEVPAKVIQGLTNVTLTENFSNFSGSGTVPQTQTQIVNLANCPGGSQVCLADIIDNQALFGAGTTCLPNNYNNQFTQGFSATIGAAPAYVLTTQNTVSIGNFGGSLNAAVTISKQ